MPSVEAVVYTRKDCHLCEDAHAMLIRHGVHPTVIDIDEDANLQRKYGTCVPVVSINGKVRFRGRVNEALLRRVLKH